MQRLLESLLGMRQSAIGQLYSPWRQQQSWLSLWNLTWPILCDAFMYFLCNFNSFRAPVIWEKKLILFPSNLDVSFIDCKTVHIFAFLSTCEQSNKERGWKQRVRPGRYFKNTFFSRFTRVRLLLHALPISLLILRKPTVLKSVLHCLKKLWFLVLRR